MTTKAAAGAQWILLVVAIDTDVVNLSVRETTGGNAVELRTPDGSSARTLAVGRASARYTSPFAWEAQIGAVFPMPGCYEAHLTGAFGERSVRIRVD